MYVQMTIKNSEMNKNILISETENFARQCIMNYDSGHDWWHIERVRKLSLFINDQEEIADPFALEVAALLHDSVDRKFPGNNIEQVERFLEFNGLLQIKEKVITVIQNVSFRKKHQTGEQSLPELLIIQDADRLDAMGAIGIARAFNYGGFINNVIYNPDFENSSNTAGDKNNKGISSTISHFYDKLLVLKYRMNTLTGKKLAAEKHYYMEAFLEQFYKEWYFGSGLRCCKKKR
jgi:uncharacterized protein